MGWCYICTQARGIKPTMHSWSGLILEPWSLIHGPPEKSPISGCNMSGEGMLCSVLTSKKKNLELYPRVFQLRWIHYKIEFWASQNYPPSFVPILWRINNSIAETLLIHSTNKGTFFPLLLNHTTRSNQPTLASFLQVSNWFSLNEGCTLYTYVVIYILKLQTTLLIFHIASLVIQEFMLTLKAILNCCQGYFKNLSITNVTNDDFNGIINQKYESIIKKTAS